jgi:hypothetical protein
MNDRRRRLSALSWFVVAVVLVRAASGGGGGLGGIRYFAEREPPLSYAAGAVVLAVAVALVLAFVRSRSAALPVLSAVLSVPAVVYGGYLATHDHDSALVLGAAAIGAFALAAPAARRQLAGRRVGSTSRRDADTVEPER